MSALLLNTKGEFRKLLLKKKYAVITILCALVSLIYFGSSALIAKVSGGEVVIKTNIVMSMLKLVTDILIPLVVFMAVTDLFSAEAQEDTIKASLLRPITRFKVMTSKSLAAFFIACISSLAVFAVCLVFQLIFGGGASRVGVTLASYLVDLIPVTGLVAMAVLINMLAKSPTLSMLLCIVVYIFFKYLNLYVSPIGQMVFTAYSQWHKIWIGSLLPLGSLAAKTGILLGSVLILYTISYIIFDGKDY